MLLCQRMDTYIQHQAVFKERRKEMLHKKWVENVVRPLQQRIIEKVISYRKPGQSQVKYEYCLKHTNKPVGTGFYCFFYTTMMPFFLLSSCRFLLWPAASGPSHHSLVCLLALTASGVRCASREGGRVVPGLSGPLLLSENRAFSIPKADLSAFSLTRTGSNGKS